MSNAGKYDVAIIGGGLAGLSCAILLARKKFSVILFEKEQYPFHKVCGEYISLESYAFIESLGISLTHEKFPLITNLTLSSLSGTLVETALPLGGIGISRYFIDHELSDIAKSCGVTVAENTKVNDVVFENEVFSLTTSNGNYLCAVACGAFGKRSNIDVKWKREFTLTKSSVLNNYVAVKYHALVDHPQNNIALHIFKNGYCGVSSVEEGRSCICYLTTARNLRENGNSIGQMEENVLYENRFLKTVFSGARMLYEQPLTISQISFERKRQVENHVLFLGDAAGMITPLCGNGMSMAMHSSRIAAVLIERFLLKEIGRSAMEEKYQHEWNATFGRRLRVGRLIQSLFMKEWLLNVSLKFLRHNPAVLRSIIRQTHGASSLKVKT